MHARTGITLFSKHWAQARLVKNEQMKKKNKEFTADIHKRHSVLFFHKKISTINCDLIMYILKAQ